MSMVGGFPGILINKNRQTVRAPVNPIDKSTIVSILPKKIEERKYTIQPGLFVLEPGSFEKPATLTVGPSSWWKEIDEDQPFLEIPQSSIQIADSVVKDYCNGIVECNMGDIMPGLDFVPGAYKSEDFKKVPELVALLNKMKERQTKWYHALIKAADVLWVRSQGNPLSIPADAILACHELGIESKEWLSNQKAMELIRCVACGSLRNPQFPVCPTCKAVADPVMAAKLNLKFAQ